MPFDLDGKPFSVKRNTEPLQLLGVLNERLNQQGRVLHHVVLNGQEIQDNWLEALLSISETDNISFVSVTAGELLEESILNTVEVLPKLADDLTQAARCLQMGTDDKAFPLIASSVNGLEAYIQLLNLISQYLPEHAGESGRLLEPLTQWLQKLLSVWRTENFVLMADYLLHELEPQIQRGHRWLRTLVAQPVV